MVWKHLWQVNKKKMYIVSFHSISCLSFRLKREHTVCFHCKFQLIELILSGFILGIVLSRRVPEGRSLLLLSIGLLLGTLILHAGLQWLGIDLSWSAFLLYACVLMRWALWGEFVIISCSDWTYSIYSTGLLLWPRNGANMQSGFVWIQPHSPPWPETAGPFWVWVWPSTGSLVDGVFLGPHELCLWPFHPWGCTTSTVCRSRSNHKASSMACSLLNSS